ncbi:hypothetical protein PG996_010613 [Apiospora saccharicola]|uniref:Myb/SANT-like domain-containing protein n=1 Tax=Apiospora saccharicola TaxID=335842 RepID=A0ABR1UP51_9PEZI
MTDAAQFAVAAANTAAMSDDENSNAGGTATNTPSSSRRNPDRRPPRFSWNAAYEATFFRSLCESMQLGFKENHSFKSGAWERAAIALRDKHGAFPEKSHLINKADNARKRFRMWRGLREDSEFLYNPNSRMVTASEEAWKRHFEKEPLSRALRGRAFDHEEFMEILFPDVIGSGGAPKRVMKGKRKDADGNTTSGSVDLTGTPTSATAASGTDPSMYSQTPTQTPNQPQQPQVSQVPVPTPVAIQPAQRPTSAIILPRTSITSTSALTPPDENVPNTAGTAAANAKKRSAPELPGSAPSEKRRGRPSRFSANLYSSAPTTATPTTTSMFGPPSHMTPTAATASATPSLGARSQPIHPSFNASGLIEDALLALADALRSNNRSSHPPKWSEQAMEIFFREFADEDPDLQLKIAEKALTDENKALVFAKSTPELRRHWVGRLREVHMRNLGGGLGLGRVGEEAS